VDVWSGYALLLRGENEQAVARLSRAVDTMRAGGRILELPTASIYLAEAAWRTGDEAAADAAADLGLMAAEEQGFNHILLQALADFPAVVSRRIDAEPVGESPWHHLGRALRMQGAHVEAPPLNVLMLNEFGQIELLVNGRGVSPKLGKSVELLARLARADSDGVCRDDMLEALFDGRRDDSARSYLRQAIRGLRDVLGDEVELTSDDGRIRLEAGAIISESVLFDELIAEAARLQGPLRLEVTRRALEISDKGLYLPGLNTGWADRRRREVEETVADAQIEAAELTLIAGEYEESEAYARAVLDYDPFRESAWRMLMRINEAFGAHDKVISSYRHCEESLQELGVEPSLTTRELLQRLRP
jgi:DNA-binding SARP family transcriptional activator